MFGRRKKQTEIFYDQTGKIPVVRSSICTGEQVAGFKDEKTGKFDELMLIQGESDLLEFIRTYRVDPPAIKREW